MCKLYPDFQVPDTMTIKYIPIYYTDEKMSVFINNRNSLKINLLCIIVYIIIMQVSHKKYLFSKSYRNFNNRLK